MRLIQYTQLLSVLVVLLSGVASAVPKDLLDGLGDESYQHREKAEQELALWAKQNGEKGLDELGDLKEKAISPEVRSRLDNVISGTVIYKAIPGTQGFMGISMQPVMGGCIILSVRADTPAAKSGLEPHDRVIELDGIDLREKNNHVGEATNFIRRYVKSKKSGEKLTVKINRNGKVLTKTLKLADYEQQMARLGLRLEGQLEPFGDLGGNAQVPPVPRKRLQWKLNIVPDQANGNLDPQQFLELEEKLQGLNEQQQQRLRELIERQQKKNPKK